MLEVGCSTGDFIRAVRARHSCLKLVGLEVDEKYRTWVENIAGVHFYSGQMSELASKFDVIIASNTLEHALSQLEMLESMREQLVDTGVAIIAVPNLNTSPQDLIIADHTIHLEPLQLEILAQRSGFEVVEFTADVMRSQIAAVLKPTTKTFQRTESASITTKADHYRELASYQKKLERYKGGVVVFGSTILATWVVMHLQNQVKYCLDEDPARIGGDVMGRKIKAISQLQAYDIVIYPGRTSEMVGIRKKLPRTNRLLAIDRL